LVAVGLGYQGFTPLAIDDCPFGANCGAPNTLVKQCLGNGLTADWPQSSAVFPSFVQQRHYCAIVPTILLHRNRLGTPRLGI